MVRNRAEPRPVEDPANESAYAGTRAGALMEDRIVRRLKATRTSPTRSATLRAARIAGENREFLPHARNEKPGCWASTKSRAVLKSTERPGPRTRSSSASLQDLLGRFAWMPPVRPDTTQRNVEHPCRRNSRTDDSSQRLRARKRPPIEPHQPHTFSGNIERGIQDPPCAG